MGSKKIFLFVILVCSFQVLPACTTFFLNQNGQMVFGRNYDWMTGSGMICTNQRGLKKTSVKHGDDATISWTSKYGSISFNQYGKEFPTGGMNEKGLVVELMWLDGSRYPSPDSRPSLNVLQWLQYQLDNCATVEELIATDSIVRISATDVPLHYLVADANGHSASIEFLNGRMLLHTGKELPLPVLTNETYDQSWQHRNDAGLLNNSQQRFSTACKMIEALSITDSKTSLIDASFSILDKVAQGDYTKWSIVYDISNRRIYFKTEEAKQIRFVNFASFDFSCQNSPKALDMNGREKGNIDAILPAFTNKLNDKILTRSIRESSPNVDIPDDEKGMILAFPATTLCQ